MQDHDIRGGLPGDLYGQAAEVLGEEFWEEIGELIPNTGPRVDVYHTAERVVCLAELPGLQSPQQIAIRLDGQTLVLEGEVPCPYPVTENRITRRERFFGVFRRSILLPKPVIRDQVKARYAQGLLVVEWPVEPDAGQPDIPVEFG